MAHPVLEQQRALEGGPTSAYSTAPVEEGFPAAVSEWGNKVVPNTLAAMIAGSVITLILLRAAGFRFSFGVNVGGGS